MASTPAAEQRPRKKKRWVLWAILLVLLLPLIGIAALPTILSTGPANRWLAGKGNTFLAPGGLRLGSIEFSWFGPTKLKDFALIDAHGDPVFAAPRAVWDRNFRQILLERPRLGTLHLEDATIDAERTPEGAIDIYETLKPLIGLDPMTALVIEIPDGHLRFKAEGLIEPVNAERAALKIAINPRPGPVEWSARLANGPEKGAKNGLTITGRYLPVPPADPAEPSLTLDVNGQQWPLVYVGGPVKASGQLSGEIKLEQLGEIWRSKGDTDLSELEISGPALSGDVVRLEHNTGAWDFDYAGPRSEVRRLEITSPLAELKAQGLTSVTGRLDIAALAKMLPHTLKIREGITVEKGHADLKVERRPEADRQILEVAARISDLDARDGQRRFTLKDMATLTAKANWQGNALRLDVLNVETPYLKAEAKGEPTTGVDLKATIDLAGFEKQLSAIVDLSDVDLAGQGTLTGHYQSKGTTYTGRLDTKLTGVRIAGVGPVKLSAEFVDWNAGLDGPATTAGLPSGWTRLITQLSSDSATGQITAESAGPKVDGFVNIPVSFGGQKVEGAVGFTVNPNDRGYVVPLAVRLKTLEGEQREPISITATARYDREKGTILVEGNENLNDPLPLIIAPEGIRISGIDGKGPIAVDATLTGDIEALSTWLTTRSPGIGGRWMGNASVRSVEEGWQLGAKVDGLNLVRIDDTAEPAPAVAGQGESLLLATKALYTQADRKLAIPELALRSRFGTVEAAGSVTDPTGGATIDLSGRITPAWDVLSDWLAQNIEPGAGIAGKPGSFRVRTTTQTDWRHRLDGELRMGVDAADVYGMKLGATNLVVRSKAGKAAIEPIDTTVNQGRLHLEPSLSLGSEGSQTVLTLGEGSWLRDAIVNDEVSRRVLSFVAPILNNATKVNGRVSADISEASFPLGNSGSAGASVKGDIVFQDVQFSPNGTFRELLGSVGKEDISLIRIDKPVALEIADRRVYQRGLVIPIGKLSQVEMDGWVSFDKEMNLVVSIPVLPTMLADKPIVGGIAANTRIRVPIRGTMDKPEIDQEAFKLGMKQMGASVLEQAVPQGINDLINIFRRPVDPNAPPPPPPLTPAERRERRMQKQAERRMRRGSQP